MSIWTTLFGGTQSREHAGANPYIDAISNFAGSINPNNTGYAAKGAKRGLKALESGEYDSNPALSGYFAPIRDAYATSVREGGREAAMGVGAKWGADNPVLAQRVSQLNEERARESEGQALTRMVPDLYNSFSNTYQQGQQNKIALTGMKGNALNDALKAYLAKFYQTESKGIIPGLAQAAGGAASMGLGF